MGSILGLEALGIYMCQMRAWFWPRGATGAPPISYTCFWLGLAVSLSLLGYFVYRACNWARRAAILLCILLVGSILFTLVTSVYASLPINRAFDVWELSFTLGWSLCLLAPVAFITFAFCHPDVAAAFRARRDK